MYTFSVTISPRDFMAEKEVCRATWQRDKTDCMISCIGQEFHLHVTGHCSVTPKFCRSASLLRLSHTVPRRILPFRCLNATASNLWWTGHPCIRDCYCVFVCVPWAYAWKIQPTHGKSRDTSKAACLWRESVALHEKSLNKSRTLTENTATEERVQAKRPTKIHFYVL